MCQKIGHIKTRFQTIFNSNVLEIFVRNYTPSLSGAQAIIDQRCFLGTGLVCAFMASYVPAKHLAAKYWKYKYPGFENQQDN